MLGKAHQRVGDLSLQRDGKLADLDHAHRLSLHYPDIRNRARHWRAALTDQLRALLARHLPGYEVRSIVRLGEGWDNVVDEVNGELVVRQSKETDPAVRRTLTQREATLLVLLPEWSTLPVPQLRFADPEAGILAYRKLPGVPLNSRLVAEPERLAAALGEFLSRLNRAPPARMAALVPTDAQPLPGWRQDAEDCYRQIASQLSAAERRLVEAFLGQSLPPEPQRLAFCHNDLGAEHLLVDPATNVLTGVIDWSDAAIADPAYDPGLIYRDFGPEIFDLTLRHYDGPFAKADRQRAIFYARCALLEDIAYGITTGERRYADEGLAHFTRTFM